MLQKKVADEDSSQTFFLLRTWETLHVFTWKGRVGLYESNIALSCDVLRGLKNLLALWWPNEYSTFWLHATVWQSADLKLNFPQRDIARHGEGLTENEEGGSQFTFETSYLRSRDWILLQHSAKLITNCRKHSANHNQSDFWGFELDKDVTIRIRMVDKAEVRIIDHQFQFSKKYLDRVQLYMQRGIGIG